MLLVVAAVVAVAFAAVVAVVGLTRSPDSSGSSGSSAPSPEDQGPLALVAVPAPQASTRPCASLIEAVPGSLESGEETLARRKLAAPAPAGAAAWGRAEPVVLRCGLDRPAELTRTSSLREINGVKWLPIKRGDTATWYAVDRDVYVALTVPANAGTGPLQHISDTIRRTLPQRKLDFG